MSMFPCLPTLSAVKKKKFNACFKDADGTKNGSRKCDLRVKPIDPFSPSPDNISYLTVSKSFPSVEKGTCITSMVLTDDSFERAEPTKAAAYDGDDELGEIRLVNRDNSDVDLQPKVELASHGSNADFQSYVLEKMETDKRSVDEATFAPGMELTASSESPVLKRSCSNIETEWVTFSSSSSHLDRINDWVNSLDDCSFIPVNVDEDYEEIEDEQTADLNRLEILESSNKTCSNRHVEAEVTQANNIIQSLNTFSMVADFPGVGLKSIPSISVFPCLRSVNLSGNSIVTITPGSLPKSLHTLDLSRNKISTIDGLRDLERLRVLNLSYNRITKISHGLSSSTLIKELYLAGNKISNVEGLHRLLKLTVLDLSFNKIITPKGLGQLVANYNSLLALNLLGNPILSNIGDDQLRKAVLNLLPHVTYLNKQPIKPHKVREVVSERVTKVALGDAAGSSKRKLTKRLSKGSGSLTKSKVVETIKPGKGRRSISGNKAE